MAEPMDQWYDVVGVRNQPRRLFGVDREMRLHPFPEQLVPYLGHDVLWKTRHLDQPSGPGDDSPRPGVAG